MFKLTSRLMPMPSRLLHCSTLHAQKLASSFMWSHHAPLSMSGSYSITRPANFHLEKCSPPCLYLKSKIHSSASHSDKVDMFDEVQKRYKHMLTQVDWKEVKNSPQPALVYGATGLLPFVLPPLAILLNGEFLPNLGLVQLAYGALILSFLGGVRWGFAIPEAQKLSWENIGMSVSHSLVAFGSLLLPPWFGTITLTAGLIASAYIDITSKGYPQWFKAMRLCLSAVAIGSLLFGLLLRMFL